MNLKSYKLCTLVVSLFISTLSKAQINPQKDSKTNQLERIISTDDIDYKSVDDLVDKLNNKIDLNHTNQEELTSLLILSPSQIEGILNYVRKVGKLETIYELQLIKELDYTTVQNLIPFVYVDLDYNISQLPYASRTTQKLSLRFDQPLYHKKGDLNSFVGNPFYTAFRYHCTFNKHIEFGLVGEKDGGETFFTFKNDRGFDFYSYYLLIKNIYKINQLVVGKYKLNFGNGLVMGASQYGGKWYAIPSFFNVGQAIRKHASVDEYNFLQGIAFNYGYRNIELLPFISFRHKDGTLKEDKITSISKTGLHRTTKELEKRNKIKEWCYGIRLSYKNPYFQLGLNSLIYHFNYPMQRGAQKYMKYDLEGSKFYNVSMDYLFYFSKFILRGEYALGKKGQASIHKLYYAPTTDWDLLLIHRFYTVDYWNMYGNSFANSSKLTNENGWFLSFQTRFFNPLQLTFYTDFTSHPWWKYRVSKPSQTTELGLKIDYFVNTRQNLLVQFNSQFRERDRSGTKGKVIDPIQIHKVKIQYDYLPFAWLALKLSSAVHLFKGEAKSNGYHLSSRLSLLNSISPFKCDLQYSFFHTYDFDSRVYIYEKGVLYGMYSPSFYGKGYRCSINLNYKLKKSLTLMAKYGLTYYLDRDRIGSGLDEIVGNSKSDLQLMCVVNF